MTDAGLLGPMEHWQWVDWTDEWRNGVPSAVLDRAGSTVLSGLFVLALDVAADLHRAAGEADAGQRWTRLAQRTRRAIRRLTWSESAGLFVDGPGETPPAFSQHAQVMAILCGAADTRQRRRVASRLLGDERLVAMSLSQRFWLARALERTGHYHEFFPHVLAPWRTMTNHGLTTWQEREDPTRSDCHGWSAWMVHDFFASVLGATAAAPGWTHLTIAPQFSATNAAAGAFDCPTGRIAVEWSKDVAAGTVELRLSTPPGVPVTVRIPGSAPLELPDGANGRWVFPFPGRPTRKARLLPLPVR